MSIDAYKIAVQISLVENVTRGLATLSRYFKAAHTDATALEARIAKIGKMAAAGGILAAAGAGGLKLLQGPLEEAKKYQTELERFRALGLGDAVTSQADKFAKGMNVMGQSARDNMKLLREATSIMGDFHHAQEVVPMLAKMKFGLESVMGEGHGGKFEQMFQAAIKVTELRGALVNRETGQIDPQKFGQALNMMTQAYVASGGLVKPQDYLAAMKTGGVSTKMMSPEMFFYGLGHFMQESGGSRTGTSAMSMFQNWAMGRMPQRIAERMAGLGLLDPSAIHYGKTGHITGVDPEGIIRAKEFTENPFKYINEVVVPRLQQKGFKGDDLNMQLASLFGIRTASNLADQFVREQKIADLYIERSKHAANITGLYEGGGKTMAGKEIDLEAKLASLKLELGQKILPLAIRGMELLIGLIDRVTKFTKDFPGLTKVILLATAALSGLMLLGGGLLLLKAAISGFALLNLGGIASALGPAGVAGGLAGLAKAAGVFMAAYAGWKAGGWLNDNVINPLVEKASGVKGATLGTWLYDVTHPNEGKNLTGTTGSPHVKTDAGRPINVHVTGKVDGRTLLQFMAEGQAKELSRPPTGPTTFDPSMGLRPSALR